MTSAWNPHQYDRFRNERSRPFFDLAAMVVPIPGGRAVDLGCGTGQLTRLLHDRCQAAETVGVDSAETMLAESARHAGNGLRFERADIAEYQPTSPFDLVFSNAALQWLPDHEQLFSRLTGWIAPGGQLAVQMPANHDHASHLEASAVAGEAPFRTALDGYVREFPVREPEWYAALLDELGYVAQHVRLQVYVHHLAGRDEVVEWMRGTLLVDYQRRLSPALFDRFLERYRERLLRRLSDSRPFFFPFKRLLLWGRRLSA